jgi:hypothetical protein
VRELRAELVRNDVTVIEGGRGFTEKGDMVALCRDAIQIFEARRVAKAVEAQQEKQRTETQDRIIREVKAWAEGKSIKKMINEVNSEEKQANTKALSRQDSLTPVAKAYKKALLKCHPDKHMHDFSEHVRATERFKYINEAFTAYKKKLEKEKMADSSLKARVVRRRTQF